MSRRWTNGRVPLPPMPADPSVCRWCEGPAPNGHCHAGCLPADTKEYLLTELRCGECDRKHRTGRVSATEPCWECSRAEMARAGAGAAGDRRSSVFMDRRQLATVARERKAV